MLTLWNVGCMVYNMFSVLSKFLLADFIKSNPETETWPVLFFDRRVLCYHEENNINFESYLENSVKLSRSYCFPFVSPVNEYNNRQSRPMVLYSKFHINFFYRIPAVIR